MWSKIKVHYDSLVLLGYKADVCSCVKDIHNNGVLQMLKLYALKIRYPAFNRGYCLFYTLKWNKELEKLDNDGLMSIDELKKEAKRDGDEGMVHLDSEKAWSDLKTSLDANMKAQHLYEVAMFLYCALN